MYHNLEQEQKMAKNSENRKLNKKMLERLIIIHNLIKSGVYPNVPQIMKYYLQQTGYDKIGEATINRDIDTLRVRFNAPIEYDREKNGYYYLDDNFEFALNKISQEDVFYLSSVKNMLANIKNNPIYNEISNVIDFITDTQGIARSDFLSRIAVMPHPVSTIEENVWNGIMKAMQNNLIIEFDYKGRWNTEITHRKVHSFQLLLDDGMYYLFGYDENAVDDDGKKGAERLFCINRIKSLHISNETFPLPANYEFEKRVSGGKFGAFIGSPKNHFAVEFYGCSREFVKDCIWVEGQTITDDDENDVTTIEFDTVQASKVKEWILSQGCNARPLEPEWLVEEWKEEITTMLELTQ